MRTETITVKIFKFSELSEKAKQKAIDWWRNGEDYSYLFDEATNTLNKFCELFLIKWSDFDYLEMHRSSWRYNMDEDVLSLSGLRLQKYLWNNYRSDLFKGKYYSIGVVGGTGENGHRKYKARISKCQFTDTCGVLTGWCYDNSVLQPIYDFLADKNPSDATDFKQLLSDCLHELGKEVRNEIEGRQEDDYIAEEIEANEYEFTADGEVY